MKKSVLLASAITLVSAVSAQADDLMFKPYIGADYQYTHLTDDNAGGHDRGGFEQDLNGANVHVGARLHKNFGVELGYVENEDGKENGTKIQEHGPSVDALGYYPLTQRAELVGSVGVENFHVLANNSNSVGKNDERSFRGRYGVGAQYDLTNNLNIRGMLRYEGEDFSSNNSNNAVVSSVGLNLHY